MKKLFNFRVVLFSSLFTLGVPFSLMAQTIAVDQPLYFGRIVVADFSEVSRVTILTSGSYTTNSNTHIIDPPTRGEYTVSSPANANTVYTITVPSSTTLTGPGGGFVLDNIQVRPAVLVTDGVGEDQFELSGRITSTGGGAFYGDGTYDDTFNITFNF